MALLRIKARFGGLLKGHTQYFGKAHLLTCHESRQLFLENYHDIKDYMVPSAGPGQVWIRHISTHTYKAYLSPRSDTLVVNIRSLHILEGKIYLFDFSQVKHLALSSVKYLEEKEFGLPRNFKVSPALRSLIVVRASTDRANAQSPQTGEYHLLDVYYDLRYMEEPHRLKEHQLSLRDSAPVAYIRITE